MFRNVFKICGRHRRHPYGLLAGKQSVSSADGKNVVGAVRYAADDHLNKFVQTFQLFMLMWLG